jgi:hypothetical protein
MPPDFVLKALNYGVLGLCAIILVATWHVLQTEQKRIGPPRRGVVRFALSFMVFCSALAGLSAYVQVSQANAERERASKFEPIASKIEEINNLLCDKLFNEVQQVKRSGSGQDTDKLEYLIKRLQVAVHEAWLLTAAPSRNLNDCLEP